MLYFAIFTATSGTHWTGSDFQSEKKVAVFFMTSKHCLPTLTNDVDCKACCRTIRYICKVLKYPFSSAHTSCYIRMHTIIMLEPL